jgi:hypothetical protein
MVRAQGGGRLAESTFAHLGLAGHGRGSVKALSEPAGIHLVWIGPDEYATE